MRVAILHQAVDGESSPDNRDVLDQAAAVAQALEALGHKPCSVPVDLNLAHLKRTLMWLAPDRVFNLVECLDGRGALIHLVPFMLETLGLPYTGAGARAMLATTEKTAAKVRLHQAGLPTPDWYGPFPAAGGDGPRQGLPEPECRPARWLLKSVWEHASIGLDEDALIDDRPDANLAVAARRQAQRCNGPCFAEAFIDGREFNLSLLAEPGAVRVLPPAEICFNDYEPQRPRLVGYNAKWEPDTFEYRHTPRRFDFNAGDAPLLQRLSALALAAWRLFGLKGYARVDFRVDHRGAPFILEINANPCLSPDAGYAAALDRAGILFEQAVAGILHDANLPGGITP